MRSIFVGAIVLLYATAWAGEPPTRNGGPSTPIACAPGEGFIVLPGSNACVRIGGSLAADFLVVAPKPKLPAAAVGSSWRSGSITTGTVDVDARTATELGTVRTFLRMRTQSQGGGAYPTP